MEDTRKTIHTDLTLDDIVAFYPQRFSAGDMQGWRALFDNTAIIIKVENGRVVNSQPIDEALPEQLEYYRENNFFLEKWHNVIVQRYENLAIVKAHYVLTVDREIRKGVDLLTLARKSDGWSIVSLVYEQQEHILR